MIVIQEFIVISRFDFSHKGFHLFVSHRSVEVGHRFMHERLGLEPIIDLKFRLGEGTGAAVAMELLDLSTRLLADIKTFDEVGIGNANE